LGSRTNPCHPSRLNLESISTSSKVIVLSYKLVGWSYQNTSHVKNSLQSFCIAWSLVYLFDILVNDFNMQKILFQGVQNLYRWPKVSLDPYYRYFCRVLHTSLPFYSTYVRLPDEGYSLPTEISDNAKFSPFFNDAVGAIDGTHINCAPSIEEWQTSCNQKGGTM
jgi:hypothetical protein